MSNQPDGIPELIDRPGGGRAVVQGCSCDQVENRGGRGVGGLILGIDHNGRAHRVDAPVYIVTKGCPLHTPSRPWWVMPGLMLSAAGTSLAVTSTLNYYWSPLPASATGFAAGIVAMLLTARWYDHCSGRR